MDVLSFLNSNTFQLMAAIVPVGIFYGATNARIKSLEKHVDNLLVLSDRLARIEEKLNIFLEIQKN